MLNYYNVLGFENTCPTQAQIKLAFKQLMLIHHPDKTNHQQLIKKGIEIIQAYNILSDPVSRQQYDAKLTEYLKRANNLINRHFDVVNRNYTSFQEQNRKFLLECGQCLGETQVNLNECPVGQQEFFINCYHCGLLMKVE